MTGPRDIQAGFPVLVDFQTGKQLTENQLHHLRALDDAIEVLYEALHNAEGTTMPGEHQDHTFSSRRMNIANTYLEVAMMMARKAIVKTG